MRSACKATVTCPIKPQRQGHTPPAAQLEERHRWAISAYLLQSLPATDSLPPPTPCKPVPRPTTLLDRTWPNLCNKLYKSFDADNCTCVWAPQQGIQERRHRAPEHQQRSYLFYANYIFSPQVCASPSVSEKAQATSRQPKIEYTLVVSSVCQQVRATKTLE